MKTQIKLRKYQEDAVEAGVKAAKQKSKNSLLVLPVGSGKSLIVAKIAEELRKDILILQPSKEILAQNMAKLSHYVPEHEIGVYSASFYRKDIKKYNFATIQSVYKKAEAFSHIGLVVVDECLVSGTRVGNKAIEEVKVGDLVESFNHRTRTTELKKVEAVSKTRCDSDLIKIVVGNNSLISTCNHPIYVEGKGYIPSKEVKVGDKIYEKVIAKEQIPKPNTLNMLRLHARNLFNNSLPKVAVQKERICVSFKYLWEKRKSKKNRRSQQSKLQRWFIRGNEEKNFKEAERYGSQSDSQGRQRNGTNGSTEKSLGNVGGTVENRSCSENSTKTRERISHKLQGGHSEPQYKVGNRDRRQLSLHAGEKKPRHQEDSIFRVSRVESVEILQQGSTGKYSDGRKYDYVYNLQVEHNNNYFANGYLVHNCDLVNPRNSKGMFTSFLKGIGNPVTIGLTATPFRNVTGVTTVDGIMTHGTMLKLVNRMNPRIWNSIAFNINHYELVESGFLSPLKYISRSNIDHNRIPLNKSRSDFDLEAFEVMLEPQEKAIMESINGARKHRNSVLVFCSSVAQAERMASVIVGGECVSGATPAKERIRIIEGFKSGEIDVVFNVNCLSVGFDHPSLDTIYMLRPTRSLRLYIQMVGRGTRLAEGKEDCLVIDYSGNFGSLGRLEHVKLVQEKLWELYANGIPMHNRELFSWSKKK